MQMSTEGKPIVLSHEDLAAVVAKAPLVSLDLIIENSSGKILVGMRNNEPARGFFFIPGGRILKNERVADAFERIVGAALREFDEVADDVALHLFRELAIQIF